MFKKAIILLMVVSTCHIEREIEPHDCPVEEYHRVHGVEFYECYR